MDSAQVLLIEDDPGIVDFLTIGLSGEGFDVISAESGPEGLTALDAGHPDIVILDLMLPGLDGMEVCRRIRARSQVPIIMLTARDSLEDRVGGLNAGADDYICKPFPFSELLARIHAVLRRTQDPASRTVVEFEDIVIDQDSREVFRAGKPIRLTAREFDLLSFLARHPRRVLSKEAILDEIWGYDFAGSTNVVEVYVRYLRRKLGEPDLIATLRGAGYALRPAGESLEH